MENVMITLPCTVWMTGLSAAGKTTLAHALRDALNARHLASAVIDGDDLRRTICRDLGFSAEDRRENVRRAAQACRSLNQEGTIAIAALVSPYRDDRQMAREVIEADRFLEVFVATPLSICEQRDPKGLYKRARAGEVANLTGVSDPYEPPMNAALTIDTNRQSTETSVREILRMLGRDQTD
jgi:adenylylsulfate kinase